jgi:UDP-glucuronate decarboxylase
MTKSVVVGAGGFLGSHLTELLLNKGHEVIAVDNFHTGAKANLRDATESGQLEVIRHDINFPLYLEVDRVYNLASPASPIHYQRDPVQTLKTNVVGTTNLLGLAKRTGARFFQASTSEVYGDPEISPQVETYTGNVNPIGIRACYDEGKRAAETLCFDYQRQHDVDIRVARIFNTYGPRMQPDDGRVVSTFIRQALRNEPITIFGDGEQTRSFCFVDDLISGLELVMEHETWEISPVNVGNPNEMTLNQLAELVLSLTGSSSKLEYFPLPDDDPKRRCPDITKMKSMTGWEPSINLETGLSETIDYMRTAIKPE